MKSCCVMFGSALINHFNLHCTNLPGGFGYSLLTLQSPAETWVCMSNPSRWPVASGSRCHRAWYEVTPPLPLLPVGFITGAARQGTSRVSLQQRMFQPQSEAAFFSPVSHAGNWNRFFFSLFKWFDSSSVFLLQQLFNSISHWQALALFEMGSLLPCYHFR